MTIVTAFLLPVSQSLVQDPADVTNELLRNLTTIVYQTSLMNGMRVPEDLSQATPFTPARSDEITALLWYTSLIMSVRRIHNLFHTHFTGSVSSDYDGDTVRLWSPVGVVLYGGTGG